MKNVERKIQDYHALFRYMPVSLFRRLPQWLEVTVGVLTIVSICVSAYIYVSETPERAEDRLVRKMTLRQNAWYVIDRARGENTDIGQVSAIEALLALGDSFEHFNSPGTYFSGADLPGVDLSFTQLSRANFSDADLSGSFFDRADLRSASLDQVNFSGAYLAGARLCGASLGNSDLHGAKLLGADLRAANLSKAQFADANVDGADFTGAYLNQADLTNVVNLRQEQLDSACIGKYSMVWTSDKNGLGHGSPDSSPPKLPTGFKPPPICTPAQMPIKKGERRRPNINCELERTSDHTY